MTVFALAGLTVIGTGYAIAVLPRTRVPARMGRGWARHPGSWLLLVTALIYLNQALFTVYVRREWHGDVSRIARFLPAGWFSLADPGWLVDRFPWPGLLSFTVLRTQAVLELPFVMLACLTVCRWCGTDVYRRAVHARWAMSACYTATFCLIEWSLRNPYTTGDIVLRVLSGLVVPPMVAKLAEGRDGPGRLVPFVAALVSVGCLVLTVYDTALLYNLGHLARWLPVAAGAVAVLAVARWLARRPGNPGPTGTAVARSLGWFLVLFLVPALPLRYGLNFGTSAVSLGAGAVLVAGAVWLGWPRHLVGPLALVTAGGVAGAVLGYLPSGGYPEARLLAAAAGFLLVGGGVCGLLDRRHPRESTAPGSPLYR